MDIERRRVARTGESVFIRNPGHGATKMRALAVQRKKPAIPEARQVELTLAKCRNAAWRKPLDGASNEVRGRLCGQCATSTRPQKICRYPARFQAGQAAEHQQEPGKESATTFIYICHGHTNAMLAPRNHTPVAVSTMNATSNNTNSACTVSFFDAANRFLSKA